MFADILPNCKSLDSKGDNNYLANIEVKIGPIKGQFKSNISLFDFNPPNGYKFKVSGDGVKGTMTGQGEIQLASIEEGTAVTFLAEGNVSGIMARVGQRLMEATGKKLLDQGFENLKKRILVPS